MKSLLILMTVFSVYTVNICAQSQWKFHVAFEDATGQKDTIWMIYDTTAHFSQPIDTLLNEGAIQIDNSVFNVFILNPNGDTTKTSAWPFSRYPFLGIDVLGINFTYPLQISWDTSLFRSPNLPSFPIDHINDASMYNDYFFFVNNDPWDQHFNMIIDNSVTAPAFSWQPMTHFPLSISFSYVAVSVEEVDEIRSNVYPNITTSYINVMNKNNMINSIDILNALGTIVKTVKMDGESSKQVCLTELNKGVYFIAYKYVSNLNSVKPNNKILYYEKIVKI